MKCGRVLTVLTCALLALICLCNVPAIAAEKKITFRFSGQDPVEHHNTKALQKIAAELDKRTNGRITAKVYPSSQLGDYTVVYEELMKGSIAFATNASSASFDPRQALPFFPYLTTNWAEAKAQFSEGGYLFKTLKQLHLEKGVLLLGNSPDGFGGLAFKKPVNDPLTPLTPKGVLCRVPPQEVSKLAAEGMGYKTVSVPWADLYSALQTGVADGWLGGSAIFNYQIYKDLLKYYYQFNIYMEMNHFFFSKKVWDTLSKEDQALITEIVSAISDESFDFAMAEDERHVQLLKDAGWTVFTYTDEELKPLVDHVRKTTWPKLEPIISKEIMDNLKKEFNIQ